jgi:signal peptidase I
LSNKAEEVASANKAQEATVDRNAEQGKPKAAEPTETPLEALASICTVLVVGLFTFAFIFQNFEIPSGSMKDTLLVGDHVVVDRTTLSPPTKWAPFVHYRPVEHGDIIVFMKPNPEQPDLILVKRAMGLPGDRIHLEHGVVYRNGVALTEPYVRKPEPTPSGEENYSSDRDDFPAHGAALSDLTPQLWMEQAPSHVVNGDIVVPKGMVFAMGDNRTQSLDSRYWGFVPQENIMGRPMFVYWSFDQPENDETKPDVSTRVGSFFHTVIHFFDKTRWTRTFHRTS